MEDSEKLALMIAVIKTSISKMDKDDSLKMKAIKDVSDGLIQLMNEYLGTDKKDHRALQKAELNKVYMAMIWETEKNG